MSVNKLLVALSDDVRRKILFRLKEGEISPQRLSYHLSKLKEAGLIYERKEKNFIYYQLELSVLDQLVMWIMDLKGDVDSE